MDNKCKTHPPCEVVSQKTQNASTHLVCVLLPSERTKTSMKDEKIGEGLMKVLLRR